MNLIKESRNDLLRRKEVEFILSSSGNPGFNAVQEMISDTSKVEKDRVCIKSLRGHYGTHDFLVEAFIYDSVEQKDKIEPKKKEKKK